MFVYVAFLIILLYSELPGLKEPMSPGSGVLFAIVPVHCAQNFVSLSCPLTFAFPLDAPY